MSKTRTVDGIVYLLVRETIRKGSYPTKEIESWEGGPMGGKLRQAKGNRWHLQNTSSGEDCDTFEETARLAQQRRRHAYELAKRTVAEYEAQMAQLAKNNSASSA